MKTLLLLITAISTTWSVDYVATYKQFIKLNETPIDMHTSTIFYCIDPRMIHGPHLAKKMTLFVNELANKTKQDEQFPVGSIIIKEKRAENTALKLGDVITVMEKIALEKNEKSWKYSIFSLKDNSDLTQQYAKDMSKSCADCHAKFKNDYVSDKFFDIKKGAVSITPHVINP